MQDYAKFIGPCFIGILILLLVVIPIIRIFINRKKLQTIRKSQFMNYFKISQNHINENEYSSDLNSAMVGIEPDVFTYNIEN